MKARREPPRLPRRLILPFRRPEPAKMSRLWQSWIVGGRVLQLHADRWDADTASRLDFPSLPDPLWDGVAVTYRLYDAETGELIPVASDSDLALALSRPSSRRSPGA